MTLEERIVQLFDEARKVEKQPPRPRFSNAADCLRKHVYEQRAFREGEWTATEEKPVRWNVAAACGTAIGELLEDAAVRIGGASTQWPADLDDGAVSGSADIVWDGDVWDVKCVGESQWRNVQRNPDAKHVLQVASYAHALRKPRWVLLYVRLGSIGKGEHLEWCAHEGEADPSLARRIVDHWREVSAHIEAKTLPDRPYLSPSWECGHACGHMKACWEGA